MVSECCVLLCELISNAVTTTSVQIYATMLLLTIRSDAWMWPIFRTFAHAFKRIFAIVASSTRRHRSRNNVTTNKLATKLLDGRFGLHKARARRMHKFTLGTAPFGQSVCVCL